MIHSQIVPNALVLGTMMRPQAYGRLGVLKANERPRLILSQPRGVCGSTGQSAHCASAWLPPR